MKLTYHGTIRMSFIKGFFLFILVFISQYTCAQQTLVQGKITDTETGDPLPFVSVFYKGTHIGVVTDFEGHYKLSTDHPLDSLTAAYLGYVEKSKWVQRGQEQTINFQLTPSTTALEDVVILAGENPAHEIMRRVIQHKKKNDKRRLSAYEYDSYSKIEVDINQISDSFREKKIIKKISHVLDSLDQIAGEDGNPILPLFISESISKVYYRNRPSLKKEYILKSKVSGVGVDEGTFITQFIGSSFQEYNFYNNWLTILEKEFVSPLADGWRLYYNYDLTDSLYLGDTYCYRLDFFPKNPGDLAFTGTLWITKNEYALYQIDASINEQANINFIEKIRVQQEYIQTDSLAWIPNKSRILIDVNQFKEKQAGILAKFYVSNKNIVVNHPKKQSFYLRSIETAEDVRIDESNTDYWDSVRHEPLSNAEKNIYKMIDTLNNIPIIKSYTEIIRVLVEGYYSTYKFDIGPYLNTLAWNSVEGFRLQAGLRTNYKYNSRWVYAGHAGYGFLDKRWKYKLMVRRILSRTPWTDCSIQYQHDLFRLGINESNEYNNHLFLTATRWGLFRRAFYADEFKATVHKEWFKGFSQTISFRRSTFSPTYTFGYHDLNNTGAIHERYTTSEITVETQYARDEIFIQSGNERISMGISKSPRFLVRYTKGISGLWGSDFDYDKVRFVFSKKIKIGLLGIARMDATAEYVFDPLPYPLLNMPLGNQSPIYSPYTYNLMKYGEFISDKHIEVRWRQYFEGLLINRIPLIKKLDIRLVATASMIVGGIRKENKELIALFDSKGNRTKDTGFFVGRKPYMEMGYGIENIFKFIRVDFMHRLSYLDHENVQKFGLLVSFQFQL